MTKAKFQTGDRVAFSAAFLRDTGQQAGPAGFRRGTYIGVAAGWPAHARVKWDDDDARIASGVGQYGDPEYAADVRLNGSIAAFDALAKVGPNSDFCAC